MVDKAALRAFVKENPLSDTARARSDELLLSRFLRLFPGGNGAFVLLYYGAGAEPDTSRLLEPLAARGYRPALPHCLPNHGMEAREYLGRERLLPNAYGILEPDESCPVVKREDLSLILVPALCCDERGYRLGHGGGYYDRYLAGYSGPTIALCRDKLLLPLIPTEEHDLPVNTILTEDRCLSHS